MTEQQMQNTIQDMFSDNEEPPYFRPGDLQGILDDYLELYRWFLRSRPLSRLIYKLIIRGDHEEARDLAGELQSAQDFISGLRMNRIPVVNEKRNATKQNATPLVQVTGPHAEHIRDMDARWNPARLVAEFVALYL